MKVVYGRLVKPSKFGQLDYWEYFDARLVDHARISPGAVVLDLGTGGGNVLLWAMEAAGEQGFGIGVDIDYDRFKDLTTRFQERYITHVVFANMDANDLGFPDSVFDCVLCGYIAWDYCFDFWDLKFHKPDIRAAEIMRVLKPGGQIGINSWVNREDIDWFGERFVGYFPEYVSDWEKREGRPFRVYRENPAGYQMILQNAGFTDIDVFTEREEFVSRDEEAWWGQVWGAYWWQHIDPLTGANPEKVEAFKKCIFQALKPYKHRDGIRASKTVVFAFGTRPP